MSLRDDLTSVRDSISAGADWLDAMIAVDTEIVTFQPTDDAHVDAEPTTHAVALPHGSKRFVRMYELLANAGPRRSNSLSLTDFFLRMPKDAVVEFFDDVIERAPAFEVDFPVFPVLGLPSGARP